MMTDPWLSVVVPTWNGATTIPATLSGICRQSGVERQELEVIVVDDGSTDDTLHQVDSFSNQLQIRIIRKTHSGNWIRSVNEGLRVAVGRYACWLHQDDIWAPERLQVIRQCLSTFPAADIVLHSSHLIDARGRRVGMWHCPLPRQPGCLSQEMVWSKLLVQNFVASCAPIFRTDAATRIGPLDEQLWYTGDWDYWLRLTAAGRTLFCPENLLSVRLHPQSQTMQRAAGDQTLREQFQAVLDRHLLPWAGENRGRRNITSRAQFSMNMNLALAAGAGAMRIPWPKLLAQLIALGPINGWRYVDDSRIIERVAGRLRAGLHRPQSDSAASRLQGDCHQ